MSAYTLLDNVSADDASTAIYLGPDRAVCLHAAGTLSSLDLEVSLNGKEGSFVPVDGASLEDEGAMNVTINSPDAWVRVNPTGATNLTVRLGAMRPR